MGVRRRPLSSSTRQWVSSKAKVRQFLSRKPRVAFAQRRQHTYCVSNRICAVAEGIDAAGQIGISAPIAYGAAQVSRRILLMLVWVCLIACFVAAIATLAASMIA